MGEAICCRAVRRTLSNKTMRDYLPLMTIMYIVNRLSWLVLQTRSLALTRFHAAMQKNPEWYPNYKGSRVARAPPPPIKCLDIGIKMGCYEVGDHIPGVDNKTNIFHPRFVGDVIPGSNAFHSVIYERLGIEEPL